MMSRKRKWVVCKVIGTGKVEREIRIDDEGREYLAVVKDDSFRPALPELENSPWSAAYDRDKKHCLVCIDTASKVEDAAEYRLGSQADWRRASKDLPDLKGRFLDQPMYPAQKHTIIETRYYRADEHTVNGLQTHNLGTTQTSTPSMLYSLTNYYETDGVYSSDVKIRHNDETETLIASAVAETTRTTDGEGYQSATWSCPETSLSPDDAILIGENWNATDYGAEIITEQLGASKLTANSWTFTRYTFRNYDSGNDRTTTRVYHGDSTYNTRIEDFAYETSVEPTAVLYVNQSGTAVPASVKVRIGGTATPATLKVK